MWMLLVLFYGLSKGAREIVKKKAMTKNTVMEVLLFYTLLSFIMVLPQVPQAGGLKGPFYFYIALKSFFIFLAWILSFRALKKMPVSIYGILDLSRVLFATLLGVVILHESVSAMQGIGLVLVCLGLLMLKFNPGKGKERKETVSYIYVLAAFGSCILNAISGLMDKILMKDVSSAQLQVWYMLFLVGYYLIYVLVTKTKISRSVWKNGYIWLLALLFVLADKALFVANGYPESKLTVMTLIKQSGCIVTILGGKLFFNEKNITYKLICALIIVAGIVAAVL